MRAAASLFALGCLVVLGCEVILGPNDYALIKDAATAPAPDGGTDAEIDAETPDAEGPIRIEVLAVGQSEPRGLAVDGDRVYWANQANRTVVSVPKAGPERPLLFFTDAAVVPRWVGVDATQVYWPSDTQGNCVKGIVKQPKDGGGVPVVLAGCADILGRINGFGLDGALVYWTTNTAATALFAVPKQGGGGVLTLASTLGGQPDALAVAPDAVYFNNPPLETVSRFDKASQAVSIVARGHKGLAAVATDGTHVYFASLVAVHRVLGTNVVDADAGADAGPFAETLASGQDAPAGVAVFGDHVYFTAAGSGTVSRVPKAGGGAVELLASDQPGARSIVVDESGVYFTRDTGEIMRLVR